MPTYVDLVQKLNIPSGQETRNLWGNIIEPIKPGQISIGPNIDWINLARALISTINLFSQPGMEFVQPLGMMGSVNPIFKKPWELTAKEFFGKGIPARAGVMTKEGKFITGWDHGNAYNKAMELGYTIEEKLGQVAGWKVGKEIFLDKDIPLLDDLHKIVIERALLKGERVPPEVLKDYPDLINKFMGK